MNTRTFIKSLLVIGAAPQIIIPKLDSHFRWRAERLPYKNYLFFPWDEDHFIVIKARSTTEYTKLMEVVLQDHYSKELADRYLGQLKFRFPLTMDEKTLRVLYGDGKFGDKTLADVHEILENPAIISNHSCLDLI